MKKKKKKKWLLQKCLGENVVVKRNIMANLVFFVWFEVQFDI